MLTNIIITSNDLFMIFEDEGSRFWWWCVPVSVYDAYHHDKVGNYYTKNRINQFVNDPKNDTIGTASGSYSTLCECLYDVSFD